MQARQAGFPWVAPLAGGAPPLPRQQGSLVMISNQLLPLLPSLMSSRRYYFELLHKQDDRGSDHVEVGVSNRPPPLPTALLPRRLLSRAHAGGFSWHALKALCPGAKPRLPPHPAAASSSVRRGDGVGVAPMELGLISWVFPCRTPGHGLLFSLLIPSFREPSLARAPAVLL